MKLRAAETAIQWPVSAGDLKWLRESGGITRGLFWQSVISRILAFWGIQYPPTAKIVQARSNSAEHTPEPSRYFANPFHGVLVWTLMLHIPRFYNADDTGARKPIEEEKFERTIEDIQQWFPGYSRLNVAGWSRDEVVGDGTDEHIRFEIDAIFDREAYRYLKRWKLILEQRFEQHEIYIKFLGPVVRL